MFQQEKLDITASAYYISVWRTYCETLKITQILKGSNLVGLFMYLYPTVIPNAAKSANILRRLKGLVVQPIKYIKSDF